MTKTQKRILIGWVTANLFLLLFALLLLLFSEMQADRPNVCLFKVCFHLYCPGCGGTRALRSLLSGHPITAFLDNPLLYELILLVLFYEIAAIRSLKVGGDVYMLSDRFQKAQNRLALLFALSVLLFFLIRNLLLKLIGFDPLGDLTSEANQVSLLKGLLQK
ncbi:MAG: DUF2752 domain-containing protein [Eubacteriales bacterium]